jgi:hypothetical protein
MPKISNNTQLREQETIAEELEPGLEKGTSQLWEEYLDWSVVQNGENK